MAKRTKTKNAKVSDQLIQNIEESEIVVIGPSNPILSICLLYTSDAADE